MSDAAPRETNELWPFTVLVDNQPVTTGIKTCLTVKAYNVRPSDWVDSVVRDGRTLMRVSGLVGTYNAWAQVVRGDETAVLHLGILSLS